MAIPYALVDNPLTEDKTDFRASVQPEKSVTEEDLIEMMTLYNTGITKPVAKKVINELILAMRFYLDKGRHINTPLINTKYTIKGVFTSEEDSYDPKRHELRIKVLPGLGLKDVVKTVSVNKVKATIGLPAISSYYDTESKTKNESLTPNELSRINGSLLKFDEDDEEQGLFFVNDKMKDFKVSKYGECKPSKIIFKVPQLAAGIYTLEIRCGDNKNGKLKGTLTVA